MRIALLFLPVMLLASSLLNSLKQEELTLEKKAAINQAKQLRDSWIMPIRVSYLYQKGNQFPNQELKNFSITIDQPIFKSGGIWAAIKYANAKKIASLYGVELKRNQLIALVIELAYKRKRLILQEQKQKLLIKNAQINVEIKKDAYLHGLLDSTFLDNAILQKNSAQLALLELEQQRLDLEKNLRDLSDIDFNTPLPRFGLKSQEDYLRKNLLLMEKEEQKRAAKYNSFMQIARFMPSLSVVASYNHQSMQGSLYIPNYSYQDSYYTYGVRLQLNFLDINALKIIEEAKINKLKAANQLLLSKLQKSNLYHKILSQLRLIDKKIALVKENKRLYQGLLLQTKDLYRAGEKTKYDVQTLQNSIAIKEIELQIYDIDKQLLLLQLYKEMKNAF